MEMCHIVPGLNTSLIKGRPYAMCLAQFVIASDEYAEAYAGLGEDTHLIMDNGLAEEGAPLRVAALTRAAVRCSPDEVVLPDYLDTNENIAAAAFALQDEEFLGVIDDTGVRLMFVPHGDTLDEYAANIRSITFFDRQPDSFGISKFHDKMHPLAYIFGRAPLAMLVKAYFPDKPLHYLGLGGPVQELRVLPNGRSCDTAYAYMAAAHNLRLAASTLFRPAQVSYVHDATLTEAQVALCKYNMRLLDGMVALERSEW